MLNNEERNGLRQSGFTACAALTSRFVTEVRKHTGNAATPQQISEFLIFAAEHYSGNMLVVGGAEAQRLISSGLIRIGAPGASRIGV